MTKLLFICTRNSCRSQMAEGFGLARAGEDVEVLSAGTVATHVNETAIKVMAEIGIDISGQTSKTIDDIAALGVDLGVTLCNSAAESCPVLPGNPVMQHWGLPDPDEAEGSEEDVLASFREVRDEIKRRVDALFDEDYLAALVNAKKHAPLILDSISDGILVHDLDRRIFYFNKAAEKITGYSRSEIIGKDCHETLGGGLCGGKCLLQDDDCRDRVKACKIEVTITTKSGEERFIERTICPMLDHEGQTIGVIMSFRDLTRERELARRVGEIEHFSGIIGSDHQMLEVFELIRDLADVNVPVFIQGESGTGKELVAAAIHNEGPRAAKLFVPVNCGALPEALLESELFGHVKGAFTGAIRDKKGRFELADGGTIFLDEIGDISPAMQVKLLRVLQEGRFERVGGEETMRVNVRIVSATNKDIQQEIAENRFREDLYYRLSVVPLTLPPLRERRNDIPLLVKHTLKRIIEETGRKEVAIAPETLDIMMSHDWPGNVRELQNWIQFSLVKCRKSSVILPEHLPPTHGSASVSRKRRRRKLDVESVNLALKNASGNKVQAAKELGVSRATLYRFIEHVGMEA